ncbi:MAG TPA: hypothetical protein VMB49_10785 [Acidobacteriaceae bacterium]|nr:hypothetical protein [Acidobacteriaceae bacterium]
MRRLKREDTRLLIAIGLFVILLLAWIGSPYTLTPSPQWATQDY